MSGRIDSSSLTQNQLITLDVQNKYQPLTITKDYLNNITRCDCKLESIAAKVTILAFPIIILLTLLSDLILAVSNSLYGKADEDKQRGTPPKTYASAVQEGELTAERAALTLALSMHLPDDDSEGDNEAQLILSSQVSSATSTPRTYAAAALEGEHISVAAALAQAELDQPVVFLDSAVDPINEPQRSAELPIDESGNRQELASVARHVVTLPTNPFEELDEACC